MLCCKVLLRGRAQLIEEFDDRCVLLPVPQRIAQVADDGGEFQVLGVDDINSHLERIVETRYRCVLAGFLKRRKKQFLPCFLL